MRFLHILLLIVCFFSNIKAADLSSEEIRDETQNKIRQELADMNYKIGTSDERIRKKMTTMGLLSGGITIFLGGISFYYQKKFGKEDDNIIKYLKRATKFTAYITGSSLLLPLALYFKDIFRQKSNRTKSNRTKSKKKLN